MWLVWAALIRAGPPTWSVTLRWGLWCVGSLPSARISEVAVVEDAGSEPVVRLGRWEGPWDEDDPDANFKAEVAAYGLLDPMVTVEGMSESVGIPPGAIVRYVLAKWATSGSSGVMELGPDMVRQLWEPIESAEESGSDADRLEAYYQVRHMLGWLKFPLDHPQVYPSQGDD